MSHVRHEVGCITSWKGPLIQELHKRISALGLAVSEIRESHVNYYYTFFIFPSGSKAGWPEAEAHIFKIAKAKEICDSYAYEDGSNSVQYLFPMYGEFEG